MEKGLTGDTVKNSYLPLFPSTCKGGTNLLRPALVDDKRLEELKVNAPHIKFAPIPEKNSEGTILHVSSPRERENGMFSHAWGPVLPEK